MRDNWLSALVPAAVISFWPCLAQAQIGSEKAIPKHIQDGEEFEI
jgi:hypothetical protein